VSHHDNPDEPVVRVQLDDDALPIGAAGELRVPAPPAAVWRVVRDLAGYSRSVPMIDRVEVDGDRVTMKLRFRLAVFSARFGFSARMSSEEERWLALSYLSGEPAGIQIRFELCPLDEGRATLLAASISFDIQSLGWLVKFFLRHHPEIRYGVYTGSTLVLLDSVRRAVAARPASG
jgi:carbon monoxide dehydrogenase subunit G